jgi:hypothetical protein
MGGQLRYLLRESYTREDAARSMPDAETRG